MMQFEDELEELGKVRNSLRTRKVGRDPLVDLKLGLMRPEEVDEAN